MQNKSLDFWVGLFVLMGAAALLFLALRVGNMTAFSLNNSYSVTSKFDNIGGLKSRAPVKSAGVVVGRTSVDPHIAGRAASVAAPVAEHRCVHVALFGG